MVGWERTKPSYEEEYKADMPMTAKSQYGEGYTFPCLFRLPTMKSQATEQGGWVLISETGVSSQYCGSHLSDYPYTIAFPMAGENNGIGTTTAGIALPGKTHLKVLEPLDADVVDVEINRQTNEIKLIKKTDQLVQKSVQLDRKC